MNHKSRHAISVHTLKNRISFTQLVLNITHTIFNNSTPTQKIEVKKKLLQIKEGQQNIKVWVKEKPKKGGIDPLHIMIDKVPSDNILDID